MKDSESIRKLNMEEIRSAMCDKHCVHPFACENEEELDEYCDKCPLNKFEGAIIPPFKIGDTAYFLLEDDIPVHKWYLSEEIVTEVGLKGFFVSSFVPAEEDLSNYTLYDEVGVTVFIDKRAAENECARRNKELEDN